MSSNYHEVLTQLQVFGLQVDSLVIGKRQRCKSDGGGSEKRGWYHLHEIRLANGDDLIVGSYGVWTGNNNNAQKVEVGKYDLSSEQREAVRRRMAEDKKAQELAEKAGQERAAEKARKAWAQFTEQGECEYLKRKGVLGHGVRFTSGASMVIPMLDAAGQIHGLQVIRGKQTGERKRLEKEFWPQGLAKKGHFHQIGLIGPVVLVAEGYATGASLYEATGLPVVITFDAGNIIHVVRSLRARHKRTRFLVCADDDETQKCQQQNCRKPVWPADGPTCPHCGQPHKATNAGITAASAAAMEVGGAWLAPRFADAAGRKADWMDKSRKLNDFNDLHLLEGLHAVRNQIEARLSELNWRESPKRAPTAQRGEGGAELNPLRPIESVEELLERFALVYGQGGTVFDHQEHILLAMGDMRDACLMREVHRAWAEHPDKQIVRVQEVGFDPACTDPQIRCNLWSGWPTVPKAGKCEILLDLLRYMCAEDSRPDELYKWVLQWLAYPIQHPGAKMKSTVVIHGPQGTGKNMFFECIMAIYGRYGRVIDQSAIEDKFNDWASRKLFLIADEVVARSDLYHIKNKLKAFITGDWIRINPKNMAAYDERNHVNMVFLSNEAMPVVLEEDDRRHAVIWTPVKLSEDFYRQAKAEIDGGAIEALHHYLLHLDLGNFGEATLPPMTDAKRELINLSLDSPSRFIQDFESGEIPGFPSLRGRSSENAVSPGVLLPALTQDFYELYQVWCQNAGLKALNLPRFSNAIMRKHGATTARKRYNLAGSPTTMGPHGITYMPGCQEMQLGLTEAAWLGGRIDAFRLSLKDYRGQK